MSTLTKFSAKIFLSPKNEIYLHRNLVLFILVKLIELKSSLY